MERVRKKEIVTPVIPDVNMSLFKKDFAKITPSFEEALNKISEEREEVLQELCITFKDNEKADVHEISKNTIKECLDLCQASITMVYYLAAKRGDFDEILSSWAAKQRTRIKQYGLK